jgi:transcriptional regulator with XRE-family HTH domain
MHTNGISLEEVFGSIEKQYTKPGVLLQGTRHREGLTQVQMAKKIKVTQADLSNMENGRRPVGKETAKRIEKAFGVNYRYFL